MTILREATEKRGLIFEGHVHEGGSLRGQNQSLSQSASVNCQVQKNW
jgi:hypothetical protein